MQQFLTTAAEDLLKSGEILKPPPPKGAMGLQTFDIPSTQFPAVMAKYKSLIGTIQAQVPEWKPDEETFAGLFTDYIAMPITADLTLLNIAMQELIDVNKKELDGIYNLPTNAAFYVPFTGYQMGFTNRGAGGGGMAGALADALKNAEKERPQYPPFTLKNLPPELKPPPVVYNRPQKTPWEEWPSEGRFGFPLPPTPKYVSPAARAKIEDIGITEPIKLTPLENLMQNIGEMLKGISDFTTSLSIESTTNVALIVDGQTLANVVKPYLFQDLVKYEGTGGSVVKRFVI